METQKFFLDDPHISQCFLERKESDFYLNYLGYDNFHFLEGHKFFRVQPYYTLHLVISGRGILKFCGSEYIVRPGEIFALPPSPEFCYYPDEDEPWDYVYFCFDGTLAEEYLQGAGFSHKHPIRSCHAKEKMLSMLSEFFKKTQNGVAVSYFEGISILFNLLNSATDKNSKALSKPEGDVVEQAKSLIDIRFSDPELTIENVSASLHISHSRLCRLFKAQTGETMISYLNDKRMRFAEELLCTSALSATEVAYAAGFREYTYFLMQFKRKHGVTTLKYRQTKNGL